MWYESYIILKLYVMYVIVLFGNNFLALFPPPSTLGLNVPIDIPTYKYL